MKRLPLLLGALACIAIGATVQAALELEDVTEFLRRNLGWIATLALTGVAMLGLSLWLIYRWIKRRAQTILGDTGGLSETEMVQGLIDHVTQPGALAEDRRNALILSFGSWFLRRETNQFYFNVLVTVVGGLVGTATLFLLYEQNKLLIEQNRRVALQTDANITESVLLEGTRRAALSGDMTGLLEEIRAANRNSQDDCGNTRAPDIHCWDERQLDGGGSLRTLRLSEELSARIASFAQRNSPYLIATVDQAGLDFERPLREQVSFQNISPERGQLLTTLVLNHVDPSGIDFRGAQLDRSDLSRADLSYLDLDGASLRGAVLAFAAAEATGFRNTALDNATLTDMELRGADLSGARGSLLLLTGSDLSNTRLIRTVFEQSFLTAARFEEADLTGLLLGNSKLNYAVLTGASLKDAVFYDVDISGSDFTGADLSGAQFQNVWAAHVAPPTGVPETLEVALCVVDQRTQNLGMEKPDPCIAP